MNAKETMNNLPPHTVKVDYHFCNCAGKKGKDHSISPFDFVLGVRFLLWFDMKKKWQG